MENCSNEIRLNNEPEAMSSVNVTRDDIMVLVMTNLNMMDALSPSAKNKATLSLLNRGHIPPNMVGSEFKGQCKFHQKKSH